MSLFSNNKRKIEPYRRFGSREFRLRLKKQALGNRRVFVSHKPEFFSKLLSLFSIRSRVTQLAALVLIGILFHYLAISDKFVITEVALAGNKTVHLEQVQQTIETMGNSRLFFIKKNHYLLMSQGRVNKMITQNISDVKEVVNSDRQGANKIAIEVKERNPGFVFVVKGKKFLTDEDGNIIRQVEEAGNLPEVTDQIEEEVVVGELLPNHKMIAFIQSMHKSWPTKINSSITMIKVPGKGSSEAQFVSSEGWGAFFDVNRSVSSQLASLSVILTKQVPVSERSRLAYVDMRSEKWVYYCFKQTACEQQPTTNLQGENNE